MTKAQARYDVTQNPQAVRIALALAADLPPAWDTPEHKQQIYGVADRLWVCIACHNGLQVQTLLRTLQRLTEAAEIRRLAAAG